MGAGSPAVMDTRQPIMLDSLLAQPWVAGWAGRGARRVPAGAAWTADAARGPPTTAEAGDKVQFLSALANRWVAGTLDEAVPPVPDARAVRVLACGGGRDLPAPELCAAKVSSQFGEELIEAGQTAARVKRAARISLVAPGGGLGSNGPVFTELDEDARFQVEVVGKKTTPYDRYPEGWGPSASPPPNLATFAADVLKIRVHERTDCFIFGSRGGQCVLPALWNAVGDAMPPCVVLNGGCAQQALPPPRARWPDRAVTIMLLGGQDYFKGNQSGEEYVRSTCAMVPATNGTTAFLYLPEMKHMPQGGILQAALAPLVLAALEWGLEPQTAPVDLLTGAVQALAGLGWSGRLRFTAGPGSWREAVFGPPVADLPPRPPSPRAQKPPPPSPTCPLGTAVSVFKLSEARGHTFESHRALADRARAEAAALGAEDSGLRERLLEFAAGQEGEAYAMVLDGKPAQEPDAERKARSPQARSPQARSPPTPTRPAAGGFQARVAGSPGGAAARAAPPAVVLQAPPRVVTTYHYPYGAAKPAPYAAGGQGAFVHRGGGAPLAAAAARGPAAPLQDPASPLAGRAPARAPAAARA